MSNGRRNRWLWAASLGIVGLAALRGLGMGGDGMTQAESFKLGGIGVVMIGVTDMDKSVAFYRDRLGLDVAVVEPNLAFAKAGSVTLGLSKGLAAIANPVAGAVEIVFTVPDVEAANAALKQRGVTFAREPRQVTATEWATNFTDPDGHHLSIFGPKSAAK